MPLDSTGYLSPSSYGEKDILFHRPVITEQEQATSSQSVRARRAVDEDGEVLLRAAAFIERHGWCRYAEMNDTGHHCVVGAIAIAISGERTMEAVLRVQRAAEKDPDHPYCRAIKRLDFLHWNKAIDWNNHAAAGKAEVIARLRSAAEQRA